MVLIKPSVTQEMTGLYITGLVNLFGFVLDVKTFALTRLVRAEAEGVKVSKAEAIHRFFSHFR